MATQWSKISLAKAETINSAKCSFRKIAKFRAAILFGRVGRGYTWALYLQTKSKFSNKYYPDDFNTLTGLTFCTDCCITLGFILNLYCRKTTVRAENKP